MRIQTPKTLHVRVDETLVVALDALARAERRTTSALVRNVLEDHVTASTQDTAT